MELVRNCLEGSVEHTVDFKPSRKRPPMQYIKQTLLLQKQIRVQQLLMNSSRKKLNKKRKLSNKKSNKKKQIPTRRLSKRK